jgi:hypothetical protein
MRAKTSLVDDHTGPHARDKLFLANHFSYAFDQRDQDVQRAAADLHWHFVSEEAPP